MMIVSIIRDDSNKLSTLIPTWDLIKAIPNWRVIKSTYIWLFIVPILAKIFSSLPEVSNFKIFNTNLTLHLSLPFSWKAFYLSSILFVIANLIYLIRCPTIIKENSCLTDFINEGKEQQHIYKYGEEIGMSKNDMEELEKGIGTVQARDSELFWKIFNDAKSIRLITRFACFLLYGIGFILIGYVFVQNLYAVIKIL